MTLMVMEQPPESLPFEQGEPVPPAGPVELLRRDYALLALLVLSIALNLALLAYLLIRYEALPDPLPLHFDSTGLPDRIEAKSGILILPAIGFIVLGANTILGIIVHRRERAAAILLAAGALFVQVLMWLAVVNIAGSFL